MAKTGSIPVNIEITLNVVADPEGADEILKLAAGLRALAETITEETDGDTN